MNENKENKIVEQTITDTLNDIKEKLIVKGKEYIRNNDRLHNFNQGAKLTGKTREEVIWGFALKHFISIQDLKEDTKQNNLPTEEVLNEKYNDLITYLLLEKASLMVKIKTEEEKSIEMLKEKSLVKHDEDFIKELHKNRANDTPKSITDFI